MEKNLYSTSGQLLLSLRKVESSELSCPTQFSEYTILFIEKGEGTYKVDFGSFNFSGPVLLFSTPFQSICLEHSDLEGVYMLQFHGDFYCIEFHKAEVACNGLLFNNIYLDPAIQIDKKELEIFLQLINQISDELTGELPTDAVLTSYLQLFLAKASSIKIKALSSNVPIQTKDEKMEVFRSLLEEKFLTLRRPADYASLLNISSNALSKRSKRYFGKLPSELIQERLILEAKKRLHLTRQSIKEIAYSLNFKDEYYFSRFFKKNVNVSPQGFRKATGISIMADLSKQ